MADRSVNVRLKAEVDQYRRDMAQAAKATEDVADAAEDIGDQAPAVKRVGEEAKKTGRQISQIQMDRRVAERVRAAGDALGDAADDARRLDRAIEAAVAEVAELNRELLRTGDADVSVRLQESRTALQLLRRTRKELEGFGEVGRGFVKSISDALGALPPKLRGLVIAGLTAGAIGASPLIGAALQAAVVGGVGAGGIVGGIVSASRDTRVQSAAQTVVDQIERPFTDIGEAFIMPVIDALRIIGNDVSDVLGGLAPEIKELAPLVVTLARAVGDALQAAEPGFADALEAAQPIIRAIANELPELGDAIGDLLSTLSEDTDGAILALHTIFGILDASIRGAGELLAWLSQRWEDFVDGVAASASFLEDLPLAGVARQAAGGIADAAKDAQAALDAAGQEGGAAGREIEFSFAAAADEVDRVNGTLQRQNAIVRAQTDPMFALIQAQQRLRDAQQAYTDAVKENGRESREAEDAQIALAQAAIVMQEAAGGAAGVFEGQLTPELEATLEAAGLTEDQILGVRDAFRQAAEAGDDFARTYVAQVIVERSERGDVSFGGSAFGGGHLMAAGGPVVGPPGPDRVPVMATAGEHVWTTQEVQAAGGHAEVEALRAAVLAGQTRFAAPAVGRSTSGAAAARQSGTFTGRLFLDSGEFLGMVHGEVSEQMAEHDGELVRMVSSGVGAAP